MKRSVHQVKRGKTKPDCAKQRYNSDRMATNGLEKTTGRTSFVFLQIKVWLAFVGTNFVRLKRRDGRELVLFTYLTLKLLQSNLFLH